MTPNEILIEKYFSKHLTGSELQEFENRYETDPDFKQEVDFLKNVQTVSEIEDDALFRNQLAAYETGISPKKVFRSSKSKWVKPLSAIAAILIIGFGITLLMDRDSDKGALFLTYFEPSKNVSFPIVRAENDEQPVSKAFMAYSKADYKQAIPIFQQAFQQTGNSALLFYEGNSLLALDQVEAAIAVFKTHLTHSDALNNRTHWYLALAYLKSDRPDKAKQELLIFIESKENFKRKEARSLLKKLD